eukprot:7426377-Pyramimonas_sp.AAC.1
MVGPRGANESSETLLRGLGKSSGKRPPVGHRAMFESSATRTRPPWGSNPRAPADVAGAPPTALGGRSLRRISERRPVARFMGGL